jgi:DNA polymerase-1
LKGDTSDNIPGVPGIGEKTATKLLQDFGSVEGIYASISEVTPEKLKEKLREFEKQALFSKDQATIRRDAPIELDVEKCRLRRFDRERVETLFHELEFRSLLQRLPEEMGAEAIADAKPKPPADGFGAEYRTITKKADLAALAKEAKAAGRIAIHIEHSDASPMRGLIVGVAIATAPGRAAYIPIGHQQELGGPQQLALDDVVGALRPVLEDEKVQKVTHNGKFAFVALAHATSPPGPLSASREGEKRAVVMRGLRFDTMIAAYLLGEKNMTIQTLAYDRLSMNVQDPQELIGKPGKNRLTMPMVAIDAACGYCASQADAQLRAADVLAGELKARNLWPLFDDVEMPLMCVLARIELTGVAVDAKQLVEMGREMGEELRGIEKEIYATVGHEFNIGSPQQLSNVLFEELALPKTRRTKLGYTTDAVAMDGLRGAHPIVDLIMRYRGVSKLKGTYVDALPMLMNERTKRIHTTFNQVTAATGRLSSENPNLQNIPVRTTYGNRIRNAFVARDIGKEPMLLAADYSQIELRIMAHLSQDPALIESFQKDEDIHASTASNVFAVPFDEVTSEQRRRAKVFNFGVLYGLSEYGLSTKERIPREEAATFIKRYFEKYKNVRKWRDGTIESCRKLGYVETLMGRRRYIPEIKSPNFQVRGSGERMAINMPVQGTASDIIKVAMNRIDDELTERKLATRMILQVHDELIFEGPRAEIDAVREIALRVMPQSIDMVVPLKIDIKTGKNWGELEVARGPLLSDAEAELEFAEAG